MHTSPDDIRAAILDDLGNKLSDPGVIPAALLQQWITDTGYTMQQIMMLLLPYAQAYARSPVSRFQVGAVAMGMTTRGVPGDLGNLYLGASYEFQGEALSFVVHAEQSATNNAILRGEIGLRSLAISASPCGYCRQFLYEISTARKGFTILIPAKSDDSGVAYETHTLVDLLPNAFGPADLGKSNGLMLRQSHGLSYPTSDPLIGAAVAGANASYAPYSGNYSAVGLRRSDGTIIVGRYAENVAYNPSLSPLQSAVSQLNLSVAAQSDLDIAEACLVEAPSVISHLDVTRDVLSVVAPGVTVRHVVFPE